MDLGDTLASDAAQEIVKALVAGLVEIVKKIPDLWRRFGERKKAMIRAEIERSSLVLRDSAAGLPATRARQEGIWEERLRALLAEEPEAAAELRALLEEIRYHVSQMPQPVQNITASASGATAQGVMFGNVINYSSLPNSEVSPVEPSGNDGRGQP
jgi:hypothetical protein